LFEIVGEDPFRQYIAPPELAAVFSIIVLFRIEGEELEQYMAPP
jgi:hypothetical protein